MIDFYCGECRGTTAGTHESHCSKYLQIGTWDPKDPRIDDHPKGCRVHETLHTDAGRTIYVWLINSDCPMLHPMELDHA